MRHYSILQILILIIITSCNTETSKQTPKGISLPSDFGLIKDVIYGHDYGMAMTFDVYVPQNPNGAGVILTNSGGWTSPYDTFKIEENGKYRYTTDKEMSQMNTWHVLSPKALVSNGYTVFEVRHGSQPKFLMSEIALHIRRAVKFIIHHAVDYNLDTNRIGLWGGSASGHLSLLIGLTPEIALIDAKEEWEQTRSSISAIAVFAAPADLGKFVSDNPKELENRPVLRMKDEQFQEYAPVTYASKDDPPTLIMHGNADKVVPLIQGQLMYSALQQAGVESHFIVFENTTHSPTVEQARRGVDEALAWFDKHLGNKSKD
ncbi:alpha/beta hydrolase [Winogradskyella aurantia]|uniref:BD-FAE-like domain-containing protein n=1 Tax=Winogradskyella aurantia TaxID=1915063 RepID=A0A265UYF8_9FLAO|nr:alpha/beta hydrolase [Winogradskyella aurantia]OZV70107.1 hypothetical protein CA834_05675 [Winogradskyella aurantia]